MSIEVEQMGEDTTDYGAQFKTKRNVKVVKKDGSKETFNVQKVVNAVGKSAYRALTKFTEEEKRHICQYVVEKVDELEQDEIPIPIMHNIVESALEQVKPIVAKSYRDYRNYKQDFVRMLDDVYKKSQSIMYIGDKENANTDSALVSTKRSLIFNQLNKELYQKFFMTTEEIQACRDGYIYVTQSTLELVKDPSGKLVSCVYRFRLNDENIDITNTLQDPNILATFLTQNPDDQYGVDGIEFDRNGDLLVGNFGDGAVYRIQFNEDLSVKSNELWVQDKENLESTDGMVMDRDGNLYIADFCANAIAKVTPDGTVSRLCQNGDTDGLNGELDEPGEPILWNGRLVVSCFDTVTNDLVINTAHELPATLAEIEL